MELLDHATRNEAQISRPNLILKQFLLENEPVFVQLTELKAKGWGNPEATTLFQKRRQQADNAGPDGRRRMFEMMEQIGEEMHLMTKALLLPGGPHHEAGILDLCMAPGGFAAAALKRNARAKIRGISLPVACGGHEMLLEERSWSPGQVQCQFLDITMLATEFGVSSIPESHPEQSSFLANRPYLDESFQLVFCGGTIVRNPNPPKYRSEALRLRTSQLILALQRIAIGGTLVMLLHKADAWDTALLLYQFSQFSAIQLFKPEKKHNVKNTFYLVAKNVQPGCQAAKAAVAGWKEAWLLATFEGPEEDGDAVAHEDDAVVQQVIDEFGSKLVELARPIWKIQSDALISKGIA
ncbi:hypothetical protein MMC22_010057 [Lobaria immixta]|nr:hypothetical protein [Lobaria immixta]